MPLQNRVTPFSAIERSPHRGLFTGNRGCLHNADRELVTQRWRSKAWIICELEFRGWRRTLMSPGRWTELFFLDEATAFAAGHRPCAYCRRERFNEYIRLAADSLGVRPLAREVDPLLHEQRLAPRSLCSIAEMPDGAMVARGNQAFLVFGGSLLEWSHAGYGSPQPAHGEYEVLTPAASLAAIRGGYPLVVNPSCH